LPLAPPEREGGADHTKVGGGLNPAAGTTLSGGSCQVPSGLATYPMQALGTGKRKRDGAVTSHCLWLLPNVREGLTMPRLVVVVTPKQGLQKWGFVVDPRLGVGARAWLYSWASRPNAKTRDSPLRVAWRQYPMRALGVGFDNGQEHIGRMLSASLRGGPTAITESFGSRLRVRLGLQGRVP